MSFSVFVLYFRQPDATQEGRSHNRGRKAPWVDCKTGVLHDPYSYEMKEDDWRTKNHPCRQAWGGDSKLELQGHELPAGYPPRTSP